MLGTVVRNAKEGALAVAVKSWVNERFAQYGRVTDVLFDTEANRVTLEAELRGEKEPVTATILRYEIERTAQGTFVVLKRFESSREWLTLLLEKLLTGKRYPLPGFLSKLL